MNKDSEYWVDVEYALYLNEKNDHASHVDAWIEQQLYEMGVKTREQPPNGELVWM